MPDLDWKAFRALPGAAWRNWELLCHGLIARNYGRYGNLVSVRVQPVVEFHLTLTKDCDLGRAGEQWGWQCKFWDEDKPKLNATRKQVITTALTNQPKYLPDLEHWVVWTHKPLREADWKWIKAQRPEGLEIHTWHEDYVANLLAAEATSLRAVYFGSAVLTPEQLESAYEETKDTLRGLLPELHVTVREERALRALRGRVADWQQLEERAGQLPERIRQVEQLGPSTLGAQFTGVADSLIAEAREYAELGEAIVAHLREGLPFKAVELATSASDRKFDEQSVADLRRDLATAGELDHRGALAGVTATLSATAAAVRDLASNLSLPLVVVLGDVGRGKTHLAARLASPIDSDPAGALVAARSFRSADIDLDRLAGFAGLPAMSIGDLLEALNAAGARAGQRLPLVIDGLHESASPGSWHDALARLRSRGKRFDNVFVVVTLRPSYAAECLPPKRAELTLHGFPVEWRTACERYFEHYKIRADLDVVPAERFVDPLFLRIFCEATNPDRDQWVELGVVPPSLVPALDRFVDRALDRIRERLRVDPEAVRQRLRRLAMAFWEQGVRALPFAEVKEIVGDDPLTLDNSLALALEDEGVLDRDMTSEGELVGPIFDALGGYLIADALVPSRQSAKDAVVPAVTDRLHGDDPHPLAEDVRKALGHLLAARADVQLRVATADATLAREATLDLLTADPSVLLTPDDTLAVADLVSDGDRLGDDWTTVVRNRALTDHPFNAAWLDEVLSRLSVAGRDLDWTEWVRVNVEETAHQVQALTGRWRAGSLLETDELQLAWLSWVMTSTDRGLRDRATEAAYWFGRRKPAALHDRTLQMLSVNDPYVPERLMAACYGVAMANQIATSDWSAAIPRFLEQLDEQLLVPTGGGRSAHWLLREYALGIRQLVVQLHPELAGEREPLTQRDVDVPPLVHDQIREGDDRYDEVRRTLGMDFHNYTLGRLVEDRSNYDFEHEGHRTVVAEVIGRVWDLGWREAEFDAIDRLIGQRSFQRHDLDPEKVDRYGKKYGWIGYYEAAGRRARAGGVSRESLSDVDIDPSFPTAPPPLPLELPSWLKSRHRTDRSWVENGRISIPDELLVPPSLGGAKGPWVCLDGFLRVEDEALGRKVFTFIWGALTLPGLWQRFAKSLEGRSVGRRTMPEPTDDYYTFAGEIPWAPTFAAALIEDGFPGAPTESHKLPEHSTVELMGTAHGYAWESYHSVVNTVSSAMVPSRAICRHLDLRGLPQTFDLVDQDGRLASRSFSAPFGYDGRLVYLRRDLLESYTADTGTEFGWVIWGERELQVDWHDPPEWYSALRRADKDQHRRVCALVELG